MPVRIDHVIALGEDLDALEAAFTRLGFATVGGGTHPHLGTKNRIILLGEGYLELLAVADPERASPVLTRRLPAHPGWVGFALQSGDIAAEAAAMHARDVDVRGLQPGRLVAPDGQARSWRVATTGSDDFWAAAETLPFLIQHDTSGEQHRVELAGGDAIPPNRNGAQGIAEVAIAVHSPGEVLARFAQVYDLRPMHVSPETDASLNAHVTTLSLPSGERIVLAEPMRDGIAARRLDTLGAGLCRVTVVVRNLAATAAWLAGQGIAGTEATAHIEVPAPASGGAPLAFIQAG